MITDRRKSLSNDPSTGCLVSIFTVRINLKPFPGLHAPYKKHTSKIFGNVRRCSILALPSTQSITPFCCRRCSPDFQWPVIRWIGSDPISQVAPRCSSHSRVRRHRFHWCPACPKAPVLAQLSSSRTLNVPPMSFRRTVYGTISLRMTPSATIPAQSPPHAFSLC